MSTLITCQHLSHLSTHFNTCQHLTLVNTYSTLVNTQHMSTHVNTCQHSTHVNTCQHSPLNCFHSFLSLFFGFADIGQSQLHFLLSVVATLIKMPRVTTPPNVVVWQHVLSRQISCRIKPWHFSYYYTESGRHLIKFFCKCSSLLKI